MQKPLSTAQNNQVTFQLLNLVVDAQLRHQRLNLRGFLHCGNFYPHVCVDNLHQQSIFLCSSHAVLIISTCYGQISDMKSRNVKFYIPLSKYKLLGLKTVLQIKQLKVSERQGKLQGKILRVVSILWSEYIRMNRTKMVDFVFNQNKEIATSPLFKNKFPSPWRYAMPHKETPRLLLEQIFFGKRKPSMTTNSDLAKTVFQNVLVKPSLS